MISSPTLSWDENESGFPTLVRRLHWFPDRRCRDARVQGHRLHAQSGQDDRRHVPDQRSAHPLEERGTIFYAEIGGWRHRCQQRGLAMVCGNRSRCRPVFPDSKSLEPNQKIRSGRQIYQEVGSGTERGGPRPFMQPPSDRLATNYPLPIVDHAKERLVALERFNRARRD